MPDQGNDEKFGLAAMNLVWLFFTLKFLVLVTLPLLPVMYFMKKPLWYAPLIAIIIYILYRLIRLVVLLLIGKVSETQEKDRTVTPYDPTTQLPVIRASVCNREKIAGFKDLKTGHFTEVKLIKTDADLAEFKRKYAVSEIKELYF